MTPNISASFNTWRLYCVRVWSEQCVSVRHISLTFPNCKILSMNTDVFICNFSLKDFQRFYKSVSIEQQKMLFNNSVNCIQYDSFSQIVQYFYSFVIYFLDVTCFSPHVIAPPLFFLTLSFLFSPHLFILVIVIYYIIDMLLYTLLYMLVYTLLYMIVYTLLYMLVYTLLYMLVGYTILSHVFNLFAPKFKNKY